MADIITDNCIIERFVSECIEQAVILYGLSKYMQPGQAEKIKFSCI